MSDKLLLIDTDKCIRCYACEIACKEESNFSVGPRACRVVTVGPRKVGGELHMDFAPAICVHCDDPFCAYFCPVGAITKRGDGIVVINEEKCNGCGRCIYGCPYGVMWYNPERDVAAKCSLCADRIDDGLEPSCVKHCIGGALQFVTPEELEDITGGLSTVRMGKVYYTSAKWKLSSKVA
ncbi:4Fe-4S dicluster domain-containing protein [Chloroflexota bacterium]